MNIVYVSIFLNGKEKIKQKPVNLSEEDCGKIKFNAKLPVVTQELHKRYLSPEDKLSEQDLEEKVREYLPEELLKIVKNFQGSELNLIRGKKQPLTYFQYKVKKTHDELLGRI